MAIDGIGTGVILCGGRGTRLQEHSRSLPKPLVEIGGRPIVWHVLQSYGGEGVRRFLLCDRYQGEAIERLVASPGWNGLCIECLPAGDDAPPGGRVRRVADRVGH